MRKADKVVSVLVFLLIATGCSLDTRRWHHNVQSDVASGYESGILLTGGIVFGNEAPLGEPIAVDERYESRPILTYADSLRQIWGIQQGLAYTIGLAYIADNDPRQRIRALWVPMRHGGCFTAVNVPPGRYWIFRVGSGRGIGGSEYVWGGESLWFWYSILSWHYEHMPVTGAPTRMPDSEYVIHVKEGDTYDFGWLIFVDTGRTERVELFQMREAEFHYSGETETYSVPEFLLRTHPDSPWAPRLKQLISKSPSPQMQ